MMLDRAPLDGFVLDDVVDSSPPPDPGPTVSVPGWMPGHHHVALLLAGLGFWDGAEEVTGPVASLDLAGSLSPSGGVFFVASRWLAGLFVPSGGTATVVSRFAWLDGTLSLFGGLSIVSNVATYLRVAARRLSRFPHRRYSGDDS